MIPGEVKPITTYPDTEDLRSDDGEQIERQRDEQKGGVLVTPIERPRVDTGEQALEASCDLRRSSGGRVGDSAGQTDILQLQQQR